ISQPFDRLVHGLVVYVCGRSAHGERGVVTRLEWWNRVERRREGERLTLVDSDVPDVGRIQRRDAPLAECLVDSGRYQIVADVVKDLLLEPLLDDATRRLAGPEAGDSSAP